jgi:hypothetical protein
MAARKGKRPALPRLGKLPPRYRFVLNRYRDARFTTCPTCGGRTRLRKLPLAIHVDPAQLLVLNKSCRLCPGCDLLIVHQDELEAQLAIAFGQRAPEVVGNDYLVLGTLDRADWRRGTKGQLVVGDLFEHLHDFADVRRLELARGWTRA